MAVAVIDHFEVIKINEHDRGLRTVALPPTDRASELAFKAAAVENIEQWIDVGARFQLPDACTRDRDLALEPVDFRQQQGCCRKLIVQARFGLWQAHVCPSANLNLGAGNNPFALPAGGPKP